jgi:hypothetical protein
MRLRLRRTLRAPPSLAAAPGFHEWLLNLAAQAHGPEAAA